MFGIPTGYLIIYIERTNTMAMKKKGYAKGGMGTMKKKGMAKGGATKMTLAKLRAAAKKMGYKLVKIK